MPGFHSVDLILPDRILTDAWIQFDEERISAFGQGPDPALNFAEGGELVDGEGCFLAPGLIDIHVHGGAGCDFLDATPEAFATATHFHLAGGTTALCPTTATATYERYEEVARTFAAVRDQSAVRLLPLHLEGPHLAIAKAGAQDPQLIVPPSEEHIRWLVSHAPLISQITVAPELPNALDLISRTVASGIRVSLGHTECTETEAHLAVERGASKVTHQFNAMSSASKKGLFRQAGLAEYALTEDNLRCELIGDTFHVTPTLVKLAYRMKTPARMMLVSDALAGAGLPIGTPFQLGRLQCRVADGYCALADGSALSGSASRLIDHVRRMAQNVQLPLADIIRMASLTPAEAIGVDTELGSIAIGKQADFVRFDQHYAVRDVWVKGQRASLA